MKLIIITIVIMVFCFLGLGLGLLLKGKSVSGKCSSDSQGCACERSNKKTCQKLNSR